MKRYLRFVSWGALAPILAVACAGCSAPSSKVQDRACWNLARVTGLEDFVVDSSGAPDRLLVSSRDIEHPSNEDGIYSVPLSRPGQTVAAKRLPLADRDDCSFHPHGISLVQAASPAGEASGRGEDPGPWLLYVINHHDEEDASPTVGCVREPEPGNRPVSVEVFRVEPSRLVFIQRLEEPSILTNANDLAATPSGDVWITDPPPTTLGVLREGLFGHGASKVVHFACWSRDPESLRCRGPWTVAWEGGEFVNGIAYAAGAERFMDRVYVASSAGRKIHRLRVAAGGRLNETTPALPVDGMPDNLTWLDPDHRTLLVAVHSNPRRYLQHTIRHQVRSPSRTVRLDLNPTLRRQTLFEDDGRQVSGASTAACVDGDLILGQVFGRHLLGRRLAEGCAGTQRADSPQRAPK